MNVYRFTIFIIVFIGELIYNWISYKKLEWIMYSTKVSIVKIILGLFLLSEGFNEFLYYFKLKTIIIPIKTILAIMLIHQGAIKKLIIAKNGVYLGIFLNWDEIEEFHWNLDNSRELIFKLKDRKFYILGRKKIKYKVPKLDKYQVNKLLKEYYIAKN